jgi:dTDP-4-dehydrorhamnose 3,5-epimerase
MDSGLKSEIDGVVITALRQIVDDRGAVLHMLRNDAADFSQFGECYFSEVSPGAVKAWKRHTEQTQNLAVPVGRVQLVIFDDRVGSVTKGHLQVFELGRPDSYARVKIPPGLWYGFACRGEVPALLANCSDIPHAPDESEQMPMDFPLIPYRWDANLVLDDR